MRKGFATGETNLDCIPQPEERFMYWDNPVTEEFENEDGEECCVAADDDGYFSDEEGLALSESTKLSYPEYLVLRESCEQVAVGVLPESMLPMRAWTLIEFINDHPLAVFLYALREKADASGIGECRAKNSEQWLAALAEIDPFEVDACDGPYEITIKSPNGTVELKLDELMW